MSCVQILTENQTSKEWIQAFLKGEGITAKECIKRITENHPNANMSEANFSTKLKRGSFRNYELAQIAESCGYELAFIKVGNQKEKMKKTYSIRYTEKLVGDFDIEARTPGEALKIFEKEVHDGNIDLNGLEVEDSNFKIIGERSEIIIHL